MDIGSLNKRITFQSLQNTENEYGESIQNWTDLKTVWASINPIVGKEYFAAETVNSEISHKIRLRYIEGIKPTMRIKFKERYFNIISVINYQERNIELQLMCKELVV